jgi:hypothetical protein
MINWIQNWFNDQCNGDWEHNHVIEIESLDNPGWNVKIDFNHTNTELSDIPWSLSEKSEIDWIGYKVVDNIFISSGDSFKLELILNTFRVLIEEGVITNVRG